MLLPRRLQDMPFSMVIERVKETFNFTSRITKNKRRKNKMELKRYVLLKEERFI